MNTGVKAAIREAREYPSIVAASVWFENQHTDRIRDSVTFQHDSRSMQNHEAYDCYTLVTLSSRLPLTDWRDVIVHCY